MSASILLVMDMINDLIHPEGAGARTYAPRCRERDIYRNVAQVIENARQAGVPVGYVRVGFSPNYRECPPNSPIFSKARDAGLFKLGTWGTEVFQDFAPSEDDYDIVKHRVSPFYATTLEAILRARGIQRLVLCGVSTNGVVQGAVRDGHDRGYDCVIIENGCCGATDDEHDFALAGLRRFASVVDAATMTF